MKIFKAVLLTSLISSSAAFAHGENKPGPHGGGIRMPGAFHTEVVALNSKTLNVYLLDMKFQFPITANSSVDVKFEGTKSSKAICEKESDYFKCTFDTEVMNTKGKLLVRAIRDNKKGTVANYETPLMKTHDH